jgi:glycosyltransferase involved in cell wall biosynthesis
MEHKMKISVIMPSYLEQYSYGVHKSASNREIKFRRAVDSFLAQTYTNRELIVISDGCLKTVEIIASEYNAHVSTGLIKMPLFSGVPRQRGLEMATGDLICYLDTDDQFGTKHLQIIARHYESRYDWCYYDDYVFNGRMKRLRAVRPRINSIGTSTICHKRSLDFKWRDGYGHDWHSISSILNRPFKKIPTPEYYVCHISTMNLDY